MDKALLLKNLDSIHTTELGLKRIQHNLATNNPDIVAWCKQVIQQPDTAVVIAGKNFYINTNELVITINTRNFTIITAHRLKV